ncbi:MAG: hypothetical protein ACXW16_10825, partial [Burkholderiaceae bacterium]
QTAVSLFSLLQHSAQHIDRIFFIMEKKQPPNTDFQLVLQALAGRLSIHTPQHFLWTYPIRFLRPLLRVERFRHSLRYQYAWEKSDKKYLFVTHNDVLYEDDVVGYFLANIGTHIGIGQVGMCWVCPASTAGVCSGERYLDFRPSISEYAELVKRFPAKRAKIHRRFAHVASAWPLAECRLNEWACMVNLEIARPLTMPQGDILPFGAMMLDIGTEWFYQVHQRGHTVRHVDLRGYARHAWASGDASGHSALFDRTAYDRGEAAARQLLDERFASSRYASGPTARDVPAASALAASAGDHPPPNAL